MTGRDEMRELFGRISLKYDAMNNILSLGRHRAWKLSLADAVYEHGGGVCLDVCCGTGDVALMLGQLPNVSRVIGLDYCEEMLDVARSRAEYPGAGANGVPPEFIAADAYDLPFKDECFDAVSISFGLDCSDSPPDIVREASRVLKPGGLFSCLAAVRAVKRPARTALGARRLLIEIFGGRLRGDYAFLESKRSSFYTPDELDIMLTQLGFKGIVSSPMGLSLTSLHLGIKL